MSMSSAAGSHAKTSALPAREPDSLVQGPVFGTSSLGSFAQYGPDGWSSKTSQLSLLEDSEPFSETWPRSGLMLNGIAYRLQPLVPRTAEIESGSWPTPSASGMPCEGTVRLCRQAWLSGEATSSHGRPDERVGWKLSPFAGAFAGRGRLAPEAGSQWEAEPNVGRVADGISSRLDRLRGLGNAVVPQVVEVIGRAIVARG